MDEMARFRLAVTSWARDGARQAGTPAPTEVEELAGTVATAVLVEGDSDRVAIEALAESRGRDLKRERVAVIPLGGAMNIRTYLTLLGPHGLDLDLAGLGDELTGDLTRDDMEALGFYVCSADLEDELIRALGTATVERAMDAQGDLRAFRTFQNQPAQRSRAVEAQQRRFFGSIGGRKSRYAQALVEQLEEGQAPRPLERLLDVIAARS